MFKVVFKKRAENQVETIASWYHERQARLGNQFLDEIDFASDFLTVNPFFSIKYLDVRSYLLNDFPYLLFYRIDEQKMIVRIIAVIHTSRNPLKSYPK